MDVPILAGLTTYAVRPKGSYRFYASADTDGTPVPTAEIWRALTQAGFGPDLQLWPTGRPTDWPAEDVPPMGPGRLVVRGQGTYAGSTLATAVRLPSGPILQIWSLWHHTDGASVSGVMFSPASRAFMRDSAVALVMSGIALLATWSPSRKRRRTA